MQTQTQPQTQPSQPQQGGFAANKAFALQQAQQAKAQAQAQQAQAQAQALANATYVLVKPSNANLARQAKGNNTQAQTNANYAAAILLQVYPLIAQAGLTPAQQAQTQQALLKSIFNLQGVANLSPNKIAVQQVIPTVK